MCMRKVKNSDGLSVLEKPIIPDTEQMKKTDFGHIDNELVICDGSCKSRVSSLRKEYKDKHGYDPTEIHMIEFIPPSSIKVIGQIKHIHYITRKTFEGDETLIFDHEFEGRNKPYYAVSVDKGSAKHHIVGGGFTITPHGIEDEDSNTVTPEDEDITDLSPPQNCPGMGKMLALILDNNKKITFDSEILCYAKVGDRFRLYILPENPIGKV